ncbi:uncharacterized protein V2V93DRAFT_375006 [Kockiozyma suomiensis]|uniref:uncharacterized protein n=1 Tax=Kockiozyma suomiensis TaxID=1337062 RepID=UPI0033441BB7
MAKPGKSRLVPPPPLKETEIVSRAGLFEDADSHSQFSKITNLQVSQAERDTTKSISLVSAEFEFVENSVPEEMEVDNDEFEFSLFSTSTSIVKIQESEPQASILETGLEDIPRAPTVVINKRPDSYYLVDDQDKIRKQQIASSAISGSEILLQSKIPWPAMSQPWRVLHLPLLPTSPKSKAKSKPSKKRRLLLKEQTAKRLDRASASKTFKDGKLRNWKYYDWSKTGKAPLLTRREKDAKFAKLRKPFKNEFPK